MNTKKHTITYWDRIMMAITFAEAGEATTAVTLLNEGNRKAHRPEKGAEKRPALEL